MPEASAIVHAGGGRFPHLTYPGDLAEIISSYGRPVRAKAPV